MKSLVLFFFLISNLLSDNQCISCHGGIEHIREESSGMMQAILEVAQKAGHKGNDCIVCHGGQPQEKKKSFAHKSTVEYFKTNKGPKDFYPAPGNTAINQNTCGMCHQEQVNAQMNSLMKTKSGDIQAALWSFGGKNGYQHDIGNYNTKNPDDPHKRLGTEVYKEYMKKLSLMEPQAFPNEMKELPFAPTAEEIDGDPSLSVYTYLRQKSTDLKGTGCASCHIPYANNGYYEGSDRAIDKNVSGHLLVHSIQSSRDAKVKVNDVMYSGIPVQTCVTCHSNGNAIALSYQGLMEKEYHSTAVSKDPQEAKSYMHMQEDIHFKKGMLCQDCHTSNDMHGDGFLGGASAAVVEIECQDCHGTTTQYPWELPIGFSDEFNTTKETGEERGVRQTVAEYLKKGSVSEPRDGYLLTARGNPLTNVVKDGDTIMMHLASGKDIKLMPLKKLKEMDKLSPKALLAMDSISSHTEKMECYTCHTVWAPQNYGNHITIDYSKDKKSLDYIQIASNNDGNKKTSNIKNMRKYLVDGAVTTTRDFVRWEEPSLAQNGEGRIAPTIPGNQARITVISKDGKKLLNEHIYKIPNVEGAGEVGQNSIDMTPIHPHTVSKEARDCESCHTTPKAMGLGIAGFNHSKGLNTTNVSDIKYYDYSKFVDANGTQLQTVGQHWKLSAPLNKKQRDKLDRSGVCFSCHLDIPQGNLAVSALTHMADMVDVKIDNTMHKKIVNKSLNIAAWLQGVIGFIVTILCIYIIYLRFFKKKITNPRNEGWK